MDETILIQGFISYDRKSVNNIDTHDHSDLPCYMKAIEMRNFIESIYLHPRFHDHVLYPVFHNSAPYSDRKNTKIYTRVYLLDFERSVI